MDGSDVLLKPSDCVLLLVHFQAGLGLGVESMSRQAVLNNAVALAKTAIAFHVPVVASTSASRVYSGPMFPALLAALPSVVPIERRNMNVWEDAAGHDGILATERKRLIVAGLLVAWVRVIWI
jgi:nicotinamidase-related amidase